MALGGFFNKLRPFIERLDALTLRERVMVFGAGVALLYVFWHTVLMDPVTARAKVAEQRLADAHRQMSMIDEVGVAASQDPVIAAALRNRALEQRLTALEAELNSAAQGYVQPERMTEMLRELLAAQHGLKPREPRQSCRWKVCRSPRVKSPARPSPSTTAARSCIRSRWWYRETTPAWLRICARSRPCRGAFVGSEVELTAGDYPQNRVRIVIGALSLSRYWMTV